MKTIIVPYRNRPEQLATFIAHQNKLWANIPIAIIEQCGDKSFNRGRLLNIGALEFPDHYYIMHDVDMLPFSNSWYDASPFAEVMQFAKSDIQQKDYLGGVTMYTHRAFHLAGGYHNDYFHRAEDNEMRFNLNRLNVPVHEKFLKFKVLSHERPSMEFDPGLWAKAQQKRSQQNQLANCAYEIVGRDQINASTTLLKVAF